MSGFSKRAVADPDRDAGIEIRRAVLAVRKILAKAVELMCEQGEIRTGGFFCLSGEKMEPLVLIELWGTVPEEKRIKYSELAREKIRRLAGYPRHFAGYQSRNPTAEIVDSNGQKQQWGKWSGAIRAGDYVASFSGFPELWDEAAMFVLAIQMGWLDETATLRRISHKRNPHFRPLLEAMG